MKIIHILLFSLLINVCNAQIRNANFEEWWINGNYELPLEWHYTDNIKPGILEKGYHPTSNSPTVIINYPKYPLCANIIGQLADIQYLQNNKNPKELWVEIKVEAIGIPKCHIALEHYLKDTTFLEYHKNESFVATDDFVKVKVGDILPETELLYIFVHSGGCKEGDGYVIDSTRLAINQFYIQERSEEIVKPKLIKDGTHYRIETKDNYHFSLYSIDGKLVKKSKTIHQGFSIDVPGVYVLSLTNEANSLQFQYKITHL